MKQNIFQNERVPALGMGCMRLPVVEGDNSVIDEAATERLIARAMEQGITYFDTAWGYHGGNSERVMGRLLKAYPRESFLLATKFPGYSREALSKKEETFQTQLDKCQTEYFDFYLLHNVSETNVDQYLDEQYGLVPYLLEEKRRGRIRHLGFSSHGTIATLERFLRETGEAMEFCQIQLNFLDWELQNAAGKVAFLNRKGLPVWVMEPLRGGRLLKLDEQQQTILKAANEHHSLPEWAFRYVKGVEGVTVTLSGMGTEQEILENSRIFSDEATLTETEQTAVQAVTRSLLQADLVPCTACCYCLENCPKGLQIPWLLELYNEQKYGKREQYAPYAMAAVAEEKKPTACIGCRACERDCPQGIPIAAILHEIAQGLKNA